MDISTQFLDKCINALEAAHSKLKTIATDQIEYEIYRSACIKEFEIILEPSGKLLKKALKPYFSSSKEVDALYFKDIFRHAANHSILTPEEAQRWLEYRDNRNSVAHDYGEGFAEETLKLLPQFILDAKTLSTAINKEFKNASS